MSDYGDEPEPAGLDGLPAMYSILKGEVASVQKYGAFVKLPGYRKQGLVHVSEMSACRIENASEIVDVGEQVWIKVIGREIRDEKVKLSFSMKAVNQGTGRDLDPNNVNAEQDQRRRRMFRDNSGQRITLEAVFNTTCKNCGCKGHFAKDCFSAPGLQYALLPEEGDDDQQQQPQQQQQQPPSLKPQQDSQKKKKKKKEKKVKKKRKRERKESESDSSSSDGPSQTKRGRHDHTQDRDERKKKKKHKKHKSHKHS